MSHYTVAVFMTDDSQSIDELLAPYDEGITVATYVKSTKAQLIQAEKDNLKQVVDGPYARWKKDPEGYEAKCSKPAHIEFLKSIPQRLQRTDEELYKEAIKGYEDSLSENGDLLSTYSPNSKWDWYTVGGRWAGMLMLKGKNAKVCDAAYVTEIDFEVMQRKAAATLKPYEDAMKSSYTKEEYMRERFPTEAEYVKRYTAFGTYAVITPDGKWHAPGNMGWWGMSSETPEEERVWELNYYDRFIKPAIENNWYMVIVDCHI